MKKLIDMPCIVYKFYGSITFSIDFFFFFNNLVTESIHNVRRINELTNATLSMKFLFS